MVKRIMINAFSAKVGGGKTYIYNLLEHLPIEDFKLFIYLPDDIKLPKDSRIRKLTSTWPTKNPILRSLWELIILPFVLKKHKIDLLFCPGGVHNTCPSKYFKTVTMFRNMLPFDPHIVPISYSWFEKIKRIIRKHVMLKCMTKADLVIFISEYARKIIENQANLKKAVTIPHGISKQFQVMNEVLDRPQLSFSQKYILYVSRFEFYKRHLEMVKAFQLLPDIIKNKYKLLLVGGTDLPYGEVVINYVKQNNLSNEIIFLGDYSYSELPALYKNADLILFGSTCENCPNILLEAMGSGQPILCSNYDPMPEFGGDAVFYMNPDEPEDIAGKIQACLNSPSKKDQLFIQSEKFSWDITARKTWDLLLKL